MSTDDEERLQPARFEVKGEIGGKIGSSRVDILSGAQFQTQRDTQNLKVAAISILSPP